MRKVQKAVHGIDLGPLTPCLPGRLRTSDKRIELAPEVLVKDVERVKTKFVNSLECGGKRSATPLWIDAGAMQPGSITSSPASPSPSLGASHDSSNDFSGDLLLIGRRQLRNNNSWMHNSQRLVKGKPGKSRCTILMRPTDAAERQLRPGQEVLVRSRVGSLVVPIEISEEIMPGVV
ncbi:MAG: molybdopterin dinucleotide binding domain-containing protein, partial [Pyrinomonadaceae bacterium]